MACVQSLVWTPVLSCAWQFWFQPLEKELLCREAPSPHILPNPPPLARSSQQVISAHVARTGAPQSLAAARDCP